MTVTTRAPKTRLRELISASDPIQATPPLLHTSDAYNFIDMITSATLVPSQCDVFDEPLLYLSVGRPAYRSRKQSNQNLRYDLPVVIVLHPGAAIPPPKRVYPFDTGAFAKGFYSRYFHKKTEIGDFELDPSPNEFLRYIGFFYSSFSEYFFGMTKKNLEIPFGHFEAEGLHELARAPADPLVVPA